MFVFLCLVRLHAIIHPSTPSRFLSVFQMRATRPHSHTCCLAFWMSSLLLWTAPRVVKWHGPPSLVASFQLSLLLWCICPSLFTSSSLFVHSFFLFFCSSDLSLFSSTPLFPPMPLLLLTLIFLPLSVYMCFVPGSQRVCVTAAALPVQVDSDWFSGASSPGPCWAEGA